MSIKGSERKCREDEPWRSEGEMFFFVLVYDCRIKVNAYVFPAKTAACEIAAELSSAI
jgi:hypothetical protein